jgi:serine/threonine protein kinase
LSPLKNLLRASAALRSWFYGHNLLDRGLPTARPLCVLERRRGRVMRAEGYLLAEKVEDALPLNEAASAAKSWRTIRAATDRVGQLLHDLHDKRVCHRDLKASNILITSSLAPVLIDLVGVTPRSRPIPHAIRVRDVARLAASFLHSATVSRTDKLRVLRAYRAWGLHGRGNWKAWWRAINAAIQRKQAKNARRGRPLA